MHPVETNSPMRIILTGGGTGGHLFPAIAAAEELRARVPGSKVLFIGTKRKMDSASLADYDYEVSSIVCYGLKGKSFFELCKALIVLPFSLVQALAKIAMFKPDIVLGVGGYVTGPVIGAAKLLRKTTVIHEQNSIPGLANRKLGKLADKICISLPQSAQYFNAVKTHLTGNPVRKPIIDLAEKKKAKSDEKKRTLLVLGGSQGAHRVNQLVVEALELIGADEKFRVIHQTGNKDCDEVQNRYRKLRIDSRVEPFFRNMAEVYDQADLLVSRAGATTLAELAVLGLPAILIPYPHAADDHQRKNAEYYVEGQGCRVFDEKELSAELLAEQIKEILFNRELLDSMSGKMKELGQPGAAAAIVKVCMESLPKQDM